MSNMHIFKSIMLVFNFHKMMDMHKGYAYQSFDFTTT
jgi:hypothetical protein